MQQQDDDTGQEFESDAPDKVSDKQSLNALFSVTYEELRRLASSVSGRYSGSTLNPTALVNEAWLKLMHASNLKVKSKLHFKRIAARAMRQVLVDAVRRRTTDKRGGGGEHILVTLEDPVEVVAPPCDQDLLTLDTLLDELEQLEPRQATLVEGRFFGGLNIAELAELLGVSKVTVQRDWRLAKAWLKYRLRQEHAS
jgi:RNA polymerase sigma factor (TIGR02999 family)